MKKFLKDLVDMLALAAYSEIEGTTGGEPIYVEANSAPAPAHRAYPAPARA